LFLDVPNKKTYTRQSYAKIPAILLLKNDIYQDFEKQIKTPNIFIWGLLFLRE